MAWDGWHQFDGSEIINVQRTTQYAKNMRVPWFHSAHDTDSLGFMLGDGITYRTPLLDNAPWMDDDEPASGDFLGLYPLDIVGIESSSRTAEVVESTLNGGAVRSVRHGTKTFVYSAVLVALSEEAAEYGMRWLKQVLNGAPCGGGTNGVICSGADLCYLSAEPDMEIPTSLDGATLVHVTDPYGGGGYGGGTYGGALDVVVPPVQPPVFNPDPCLAPYLRTFRNVTVTQGPNVTSKQKISDGGAAWTVTFTMVAANPYEFGREVPIIEDFMEAAIPWAAGVTGGTFDAEGAVYAEVPCYAPVYAPVYDPLCPALIPPPPAPDVPLGCYVPPQNWHRRQITIPRQFVPLWGDVLPVIQVHARHGEVRNMRVRFYTDVNNTGNPNQDPCAWCGDIVFSYIPANSTLVFDGPSQEVYVQGQGNVRRRAESLVFRTDGKPFDWPALTCGFGYIVTFDLAQTQVPPAVDLSLTARVI